MYPSGKYIYTEKSMQKNPTSIHILTVLILTRTVKLELSACTYHDPHTRIYYRPYQRFLTFRLRQHRHRNIFNIRKLIIHTDNKQFFRFNPE